MIFHSYEYLFFIIIFGALWFSIKQLTFRLILLTCANCLFYSWWDPRFLSIIILSSFIDFYCGLNVRNNKKFLYLSFIVNFSTLFFFKYFIEFSHLASQLSLAFGLTIPQSQLELILPLGISYYTFQSFSYTVDIYRGEAEPERNFLKVFSYVSFFPQLIAGPIERVNSLLPQLVSQKAFDKVNLQRGFSLFLIGLFQKLVIADRCFFFYTEIIHNPKDFTSPLSFWLATLFFWVFLYNDFSGYCLMARGSAKMLGIELSINFKNPFIARNVSDFFSRWQITLTSWVMDYLYYPLTMKTEKPTFSLFWALFFIGVWHGASPNWALWGIGLFLHLYFFRTLLIFINKKFRLGRHFNLVFSIFSMFFFYLLGLVTQIKQLSDLPIIAAKLLSGFSMTPQIQSEWFFKGDLFHFQNYIDTPLTQISIAIILSLMVFLVSYFQGDRTIDEYLEELKPGPQQAFYIFIILALIFLRFPETRQSFYYFQF